MSPYNNKTMPDGWSESKLSLLLIDPKRDLVDGPFGSNLKRTDFTESGIPVFKIQNTKANRFVDGTLSYVSSEKAAELKGHSFKKGDLIITKLGNPLGLCCEVPGKYPKGLIVADLMRLRLAHKHVSKRYLIYLINSPVIQDQFKMITKGTTRPRVNLTIVRELDFPLPPIREQHRIVAKIEEFFSELDKGIESLKTAREQLKVYRQALLKNAFEGKLTEQWRQGNAETQETADQILERIKLEREARYQQLEEWKAAVKQWDADGKEGKKPSKPKPITEKGELTEDQLESLPTVPFSFFYIYPDELGDLGRGKSKHRPRNAPKLFGGKYPFIQTGEVKAANRVVTEYKQTLSDFGIVQSKLWPKGTLCITIAANIVETAFLGFDCCFPDSVVGFTAYDNVVRPKYVELFIMSVRARIESYTPATEQKNINLTTLENLVVPITSLKEQDQIIEMLGVQFTIIDQHPQPTRQKRNLEC